MRRAGCYVEVFEQDKAIGGRLATFRSGMLSYDHGTQYLMARTPRFKSYLDELLQTGYAASWRPRTVAGDDGAGQTQQWYVGTPTMSAAVRPLAEGVRVHTCRRVHTIQRVDKAWHLWFEDQTSAGPFAAIAVAVPARDARLLLGRFESISAPIDRVQFLPVWAVMVHLPERVLHDADVYSDMSKIIRWIGRNNAKPHRNSRGDQLVIHAAQAWSRETQDFEPDVVAEEIWSEASNVLGLPPIRPTSMHAVLWRDALVETPLGESCLYTRELQLGACGDWCLGRLAEQAFESGASLGKLMVDNF